MVDPLFCLAAWVALGRVCRRGNCSAMTHARTRTRKHTLSNGKKTTLTAMAGYTGSQPASQPGCRPTRIQSGNAAHAKTVKHTGDKRQWQRRQRRRRTTTTETDDRRQTTGRQTKDDTELWRARQGDRLTLPSSFEQINCPPSDAQSTSDDSRFSQLQQSPHLTRPSRRRASTNLKFKQGQRPYRSNRSPRLCAKEGFVSAVTDA